MRGSSALICVMSKKKKKTEEEIRKVRACATRVFLVAISSRKKKAFLRWGNS